jgi:hypothetical protein
LPKFLTNNHIHNDLNVLSKLLQNSSF